MGFFRQTRVLVGASLRSLHTRLGAVAVTLIGVTVVVAVFGSFLALEGALGAMIGTARPHTVDVLRHGAAGVPASVLSRDAVKAVMDAPGIKRTPEGKPYVVGTVMTHVSALDRGGLRRQIILSGDTAGVTLVDPDIQLVAGRRYHPGAYELIVSKSIHDTYQGFDLGASITLHGKKWKVVGVYTTPNAIGKSVLHTDAGTLMAAFDIETFTFARAVLVSPDAFRNALAANPAIHVDVRTDREVMQNVFGAFIALIKFAAYFIGLVMAFGAACGALNSLYASVDARRRELATLRAVGFRRSAVLASVLVEGVLIALPGAFIGAGIAWLLFNGHQTNISGFVLSLSLPPAALGASVIWALTIGLIGASLPALRVIRTPIAKGLGAV